MTVSADDDALRGPLGAARDSHAAEYESILSELESSGVEIEWRVGELAYSPAPGGPGRMILDPDASIGALRHEYRHFCDVREAGFPGLQFYYRNPLEFARAEVRGYLRSSKSREQPETLQRPHES